MADETGKFRFPGRAVRALFASNEGRDAPEMAYSETMSRHPPPQMVDRSMDQPTSTVGSNYYTTHNHNELLNASRGEEVPKYPVLGVETTECPGLPQSRGNQYNDLSQRPSNKTLSHLNRNQGQSPQNHADKGYKKSVCGVRRVTMVLLILLAIVVVGAAVGGGVGGSLAVQ